MIIYPDDNNLGLEDTIIHITSPQIENQYKLIVTQFYIIF